MNAFFDGYFNSKSTLKQFVEKYETAMGAKIEKENAADNDSMAKVIPCATPFGFERQFQRVYTNTIFRLVSAQACKVMFCEATLTTEDGGIVYRYAVKEKRYIDINKSRWLVFNVCYNIEMVT